MTGGVKVALNVGFWYDEVNNDIPGVDLTNGQQHIVTVTRQNRGRVMYVKVSVGLVHCCDWIECKPRAIRCLCNTHVTRVCVQVDEYPVLKKDWNDILPANADTRLDNPKNIYLGRTRKCFYFFSFFLFVSFRYIKPKTRYKLDSDKSYNWCVFWMMQQAQPQVKVSRVACSVPSLTISTLSRESSRTQHPLTSTSSPPVCSTNYILTQAITIILNLNTTAKWRTFCMVKKNLRGVFYI